ncbi:MAG: 5-formyltetrahydrofolate cyclo-ligase [Granulosicoccus sp.]
MQETSPASPAEARNRLRADLRASLRLKRSSLSAASRTQAAKSAAKLCTPEIEHASSVAGYFAVAGELALDELLAACRLRGQITLAPVINDESLLFAPFDESTAMQANRYQINEPAVGEQHLRSPESLDIVLLPLTGFDASGNRLGMGGGFYDRSFAQRRDAVCAPTLIGMAYSLQQVDTVHPDWWDVPLDLIVTDKALVRPSDQRKNN